MEIFRLKEIDMKTDKIAQKLADILPSRPVVPGMSNPDTSKLVEQEATRIKSNKMQRIGSY